MTIRKKISRNSSKSCSKQRMDLDRISNLSDPLIDQILSCLPIKDAVKTSVLSSKWRYKWAMISCLVFDSKSLPAILPYKFVSNIDRLLFLHSGPICKFKLSYQQTLSSSEIDKWILYLSRHPMNEFVLKMSNPERYKVPSCLSSWQNLTLLDLRDCLLRSSSTFKGFKSLKSLNLERVTLDQDVFENLISNCPLLEKLTLKNLHGVNHCNISGPNLQSFSFEGPFVDVTLHSASHLAVFSMNTALGKSGNLIKLLADMPKIQKLVLVEQSFSCLAYDVIGEELPLLPLPCVNLYHLTINVDFTRYYETSMFLFLLRSAPNLRVLVIDSFLSKVKGTSNDVWQAENWNCPFIHLRCVELWCFHGIQAEIDFIEFMLLTSPVLKRMTVTLNLEHDYGGDKGKLMMVKQLLQLRRVAPQSQIIFKDE